MRHGIAGNRLGRQSGLRKATIRDLAKATIIHQRICTTKPLAKEARKLVEKLITLGKEGSLASKRHAFAVLCDHQLVSDLFRKTAPLFKNRIGGYTRIISLGNRRGDNAQMALLELTEKTEVIISKPKSTPAVKKGLPKVETVKEKKSEVKQQTQTVEPLKTSTTKKDAHKEVDQKNIAKDKVPGKNIVGGIRKMFNRKTGNQ
jgi:large subunit ribosomal protein L17